MYTLQCILIKKKVIGTRQKKRDQSIFLVRTENIKNNRSEPNLFSLFKDEGLIILFDIKKFHIKKCHDADSFFGS